MSGVFFGAEATHTFQIPVWIGGTPKFAQEWSLDFSFYPKTELEEARVALTLRGLEGVFSIVGHPFVSHLPLFAVPAKDGESLVLSHCSGEVEDIATWRKALGEALGG